MFTNKTFAASINENSPPGSHVVKLSAIDKDISAKNRNYIFKIRSSLDPQSANKFSITTLGENVLWFLASCLIQPFQWCVTKTT